MRKQWFVLILFPSFLTGCHGSAGPHPASAESAAAESAATDEDTATLWVKGLSCPLCAHNIDKQLARVPGVRNVAVDLSEGKVTLRVSADRPPTREQLARAVDASGFTLDRIELPADAAAAPVDVATGDAP